MRAMASLRIRSGLWMVIVVASVIAAMLVIPRAAAAEPITYRFEGTVYEIQNPSALPGLPFAVGNPFVMEITADPAAVDSDGSPDIGRYESGVSAMYVSVGSYATSITLTNPSLDVINFLSSPWADEFRGGAYVSPVEWSTPLGVPVGGVDLYQAGFNFWDEAQTAIPPENGDALLTTPIDLTEFSHGGGLFLQFSEFIADCDFSIFVECDTLFVAAEITNWSIISAGPVDDDGDGVDDAIDTGAGAFDDGNDTTGEILDDGGLDVYVADADPGGVRVTAAGSGGPAVIEVCGFTINLTAGSDAIITCGSVIVEATEGVVTVVLADGDTVTVPEGAHAEVDQLVDGTVEVDNLGSVPVTVTLNGTDHTVDPGASPSFLDIDQDGVFDVDDMCLATSTLGTATTPKLKDNRYAVDAFGAFMSGNDTDSGVTIFDTNGCDEHQIIESLGLGKGHTKFGLSMSALQEWLR